ncbi:MAG TPA: DNA repair protein RecN [Candidatus Desulfofervidus auxilii]|uniref:DNA repair protein RecN n=1 Tax=Desulfofervidus auxilii TaxID=1621989 RepID=A0A7C0U2B4_DESA2|nr:DNA repair protein RecN [Candidatus Desulfofervidus auxilii]
MLQSLHIEHLAIIDHLEMDFSPGLNIITGETGAGKSIIINAIKLLWGERASAELIRYGEETAIIEALFLLDESIIQLLQEKGFNVSKELLIKRIINRSGRSRVFVNDQLVTLPILNQITKNLFTLSGQYEYQNILSSEYQLSLLDNFCDLQEKKIFQEIYKKLIRLIEQKKKILEKIAHYQEKQELLKFQQRELEEAKLQIGEEEELLQEREILRNAEFLKKVAENGYLQLYGGERTVIEILANLQKQMEIAASYEPKWQEWLETLKDCFYQLEDIAHVLKNYKESMVFEPDKLERIERRLAELNELKNKYKAKSIAELLEIKEKIEKELNSSEDLNIFLEQLDKEIFSLKEKLAKLAEELTEKRKKAAKFFENLLQDYLKNLGMPYARCEIKFTPLKIGLLLKENLWVNEEGAEEIEFLFSANLGEPSKPLAKIASGGELSRFLLALKTILGKKAGTETVIFDEIDTGVGGDLGSIIGRHLKELSKNHQIICITHLPQIACYGDAHFKVEKQIISGRTVTGVRLLKKDEKIKELVRMLGGKPSSYIYAQSLIEQANK